jgi:hypothetical protein
MNLTRAAALLYAVLTAAVVVFQIALAAGAPWGDYAMGGANPGQFPPELRVGALVQAALLAGMAVVVLSRAGLILPGWYGVTRWLIWVVVALVTLTFVLNLITPSGGDRLIWAPTIFLLLVSSIVVALSKTP